LSKEFAGGKGIVFYQLKSSIMRITQIPCLKKQNMYTEKIPIKKEKKMLRKIRFFILVISLLAFITACPDAGSDTPPSPGELTDEQIGQAVWFLVEASKSGVVYNAGFVQGSGVVYTEDEDTFCFTFTGYDISDFPFITGGYKTISGTIVGDENSDYSFDITLAGGAVKQIQFTVNLHPKQDPPATVTVTIDSVQHTIPFPDSNPVIPGIPDSCGITYDTETHATIHAPSGWIALPPTPDVEYCTASKEGAFVNSLINGSYEYSGYSYPYNITSTADVDSEGAGSGTLSAGTEMSVEGFKGNTDKEYQAFGTAYHYVYFSATSDNPETTEIQITFTVSGNGRLSYSIDNQDDHATAFSSLSVDADIFRMGWDEDEGGNKCWEMTDRVSGTSEGLGYAVVGYTDTYKSMSNGIFDGNVTTPLATDSVLSGSGSLSCSIKPENEMMCLSLDLMARSIVEFTGINLSDKGIASADCTNASLSYSYTATDPDHPGASITVKFFIPDF